MEQWRQPGAAVLEVLLLLCEAGGGSDVSARSAAPVVGGLWSCMVLTLLVPAAYVMWRRHQLRMTMDGARTRRFRSRVDVRPEGSGEK